MRKAWRDARHALSAVWIVEDIPDRRMEPFKTGVGTFNLVSSRSSAAAPARAQTVKKAAGVPRVPCQGGLCARSAICGYSVLTTASTVMNIGV